MEGNKRVRILIQLRYRTQKYMVPYLYKCYCSVDAFASFVNFSVNLNISSLTWRVWFFTFCPWMSPPRKKGCFLKFQVNLKVFKVLRIRNTDRKGLLLKSTAVSSTGTYNIQTALKASNVGFFTFWSNTVDVWRIISLFAGWYEAGGVRQAEQVPHMCGLCGQCTWGEEPPYLLWSLKKGFRIRIQLNTDPAKNLNPDPEDLGPDPSYFLTLSLKKFKLLYNYRYMILWLKEVNWKIECCKSHKKVKLCCDYLTVVTCC